MGLPKQIPEPKVEKKVEETKQEQEPGTEQQVTNVEKSGTENQDKKEEEEVPKPTKSLKQMFMSFLQDANE